MHNSFKYSNKPNGHQEEPILPTPQVSVPIPGPVNNMIDKYAGVMGVNELPPLRSVQAHSKIILYNTIYTVDG